MNNHSPNPRVFTLVRPQDETGISGTGRVLDGVIFHTGQVVICWRSDHSSLTIFDSYEAFKAIHIDPHPSNHSQVNFADECTL
jgi:hypothetical protein